jgi:glycosyltransferase involved in cell wall biosynthesis
MLVTAVMITGKTPSRARFAKAAVRCFLEQTYKQKELLIINDGNAPLNVNERHVNEVMVPFDPQRTLGELRNFAFEKGNGDLLLQWDDDDWHHPNRMAEQVSNWRPGTALLLREQIRYSFVHHSAFVLTNVTGIKGTILHDRNCKHRYPPMRQGEDGVFWAGFANKIIMHSQIPLYIRFFHGFNTCTEKNIMGAFATRPKHRHWDLPDTSRKMLESVLSAYYSWDCDLTQRS